MNPADSFPAPFRLHDRLVRPALNRIAGPGGEDGVEPRVMQVLLVLAENPDQVVSREMLMDRVWADAVVGDEILTRAVSELRRILDDDSRRPRFIETIRQHGYRLIAPVEAVADSPAAAAAPDTAGPGAEPAVPPVGQVEETRPGSRLPWGLVALAVVAAVLAWFVKDRTAPPPAAPAVPAAVPLTSLVGREMHPTVTADGARVAFVWSGEDGRSPGVFVKQRNSETLLRLSGEPGWPAWPVWSPDAQTVAFVQTFEETSTICTVAALGGPVRRLHQVRGLVQGLDWSPDGTALVFSAAGEGGSYRLVLVEPDSGETIGTAGGERPGADDILPRFAPDGGGLAWMRRDQAGDGSVQFQASGSPAPLALASGVVGLQGLAWAPGGRGLLFATGAGTDNLWRVGRSGGVPERVATAGVLAWYPSVARDTGDLVFEQAVMDRDLWRLSITGSDPWQSEIAPFLASTRWEYGADFSPDGQTLVFVSARAGRPALWLATATGGDVRRLGAFEAPAITGPRWSPDGSEIAFNAVVGGVPGVYVMTARGGEPRRADLPAGAVFTAWSADGRDLLAAADRGEGWRILRHDPATGSLAELTPAGGTSAAESADGRELYHTRPGLAGIWRAPVAGGEPERICRGPEPPDRRHWRLGDGWLVWVMRSGSSAFLMRHDLAAGRSDFLAELPGLAGSGLAVTPDGRTVLFSRNGAAAGDLMILPAAGLWAGE